MTQDVFEATFWNNFLFMRNQPPAVEALASDQFALKMLQFINGIDLLLNSICW